MTVPAAPTRLIVAPWASLDDLPEDRPTAHDPDYEELLWQASEILYGATARQWPGEQTATRRLVVDPGGCYGWTATDRIAVAAWPAAPAAVTVAGAVSGWSVLQLPDPPVLQVVSVTVDGTPLALDAVDAQLPVGLLSRRDGQRWGPAREVEVTYRHGLNPPAGGVRSAILLTLELGKAWAQDKSCRLPQRIQTLTREGVTIGFVDKFEALDRGRTGIYEIDLWITSVNPARLQRRSRVWSPDIATRRRM